MPPEWTGLNWRARPAHAWTCSMRVKAVRRVAADALIDLAPQSSGVSRWMRRSIRVRRAPAVGSTAATCSNWTTDVLVN